MLDWQPHRQLDADSPHDHLGCYGNSPRSGWIVACTHPQAETWANLNLQRRGYRTYLPLYAAKRRDPVTHTLTRIVQRPLFAGYLFCWYDSRDPRRPIRETPGVRDVIRCGSEIQWVRPGVLEAVQASQAERAVYRQPSAILAPGTPVAVSKGALAGWPAVVTQVGHDMATVAVMMLGHLREVAVQLNAIQPRTE